MLPPVACPHLVVYPIGTKGVFIDALWGIAHFLSKLWVPNQIFDALHWVSTPELEFFLLCLSAAVLQVTYNFEGLTLPAGSLRKCINLFQKGSLVMEGKFAALFCLPDLSTPSRGLHQVMGTYDW